MGNCINVPQFPPLQKMKNFIYCEGEDFNLALPVEKIASGASQGLKLPTHCRSSSPMMEIGREVKIVMSKEQLELILRNSKKFGSKGMAFQFSDAFEFDEHCPRWRPALPTIPEV